MPPYVSIQDLIYGHNCTLFRHIVIRHNHLERIDWARIHRRQCRPLLFLRFLWSLSCLASKNWPRHDTHACTHLRTFSLTPSQNIPLYTQSHTHSRTLIHAQSFTHSLSLSLVNTVTHTSPCTESPTLPRTFTPTSTYTQSFKLSLAFSHPHSYVHTVLKLSRVHNYSFWLGHQHPHVHTVNQTLSYNQPHLLSRILSHTLVHTVTHTLV